ncbi:MAG: TPM domain-containing protein [Chryseolinea sp.]
MNIKQKFSDSDLQRIKDAVSKAESKISGEIVPVIVEHSGRYPVTNYKGALVGSSFAFIFMILMDRYFITEASNGLYNNTLYYDPVFIFIFVVLAGLVGALIPSLLQAAKRLLVSQQTLDSTTRQRAESAFLEEQIFNTRQRTGIMIFISFFERKVMVVADHGISKVVNQKEWDSIVSDMIANIRNGKVVEGLENAILKCGEILLEKGFVKTEDDINELRDDLRID